MFDFSQSKVLITGATGGIGRDISESFVKHGATVFLTGTSEIKLDSFAAELRTKYNSDKIFTGVLDLSNRTQIKDFIDNVNKDLGGIDVAICNAGITKDGLAIRMKDEDWDNVININLTSVFEINKKVASIMMKQKYGRIINIASVVAITGNPGQINYCASKAGVIGMTKSLALEIASRGITVNAIAPGFIETPMTDILSDDVKNKITEMVPMKRYGYASEISAGVLFLASQEASYITGTVLNISGGLCTY